MTLNRILSLESDKLINPTFSSIKFIFLCIIALAMIFAFNSCDEYYGYIPVKYSDGENYKTFITPKEADFRLSFEYPSYYALSYQPNRPPIGTYITLSGVPSDKFFSGSIKTIEIHITFIGGGFPDANTAVKERISDLKWSWVRNFRLKAKYNVCVDGLEGQEIVVTYRQRPIYGSGHGRKPRDPAFVVRREVFFDYRDVLWHISLYTDADSYEQTKVDFEHILKTFQVVKHMFSN